MQEVLARFADEDVGELWGRGEVGGEMGGFKGGCGRGGKGREGDEDDGDDDVGVVISRENGIFLNPSTAARTRETTSAMRSGSDGPTHSIVGHDGSGTSSPTSATASMPSATSTSTTPLRPQAASTSSRYTSKIRSSPLTLTNPDTEGEVEARPKKRKVALGYGASTADTSAPALTKTKRIRTAREAGEMTKKRKEKGKNAIDDLFAGLG